MWVESTNFIDVSNWGTQKESSWEIWYIHDIWVELLRWSSMQFSWEEVDANKNFLDFVNHQRFKRVHNIWWLTGAEIDNDTIREYFHEKGINLWAMRDFLRKNIPESISELVWEEIFIEWKFTNIEKGEWFDEIILQIEAQWSFESPQELVYAISDYIKDNMSYDAFLSLFLMFHVWRWIQDKDDLRVSLSHMQIWMSEDSDRIADTLLDEWWNLQYLFYQLAIKDIFDNPNHTLTEYHLGILAEVLLPFRWEWINAISDEFHGIVWYLLQLIDSRDIAWLKSYFQDGFWEDPNKVAFIRSLLFESGITMLQSWATQTVAERLKHERVWVCRHFSVIAKHIYNEMVEKWSDSIKFRGESEVLYVLNNDIQHAYNIVMYEDQHWVIHKQYFDITLYIMNRKLFYSYDDYWQHIRDGEIFVENQITLDNKFA